jgi:class 3 adenylate cyclase
MENMTSKPEGHRPEFRWQEPQGILFVDLSGYTHLLYHCATDRVRMEKLALAMYRFFAQDPRFPDVRVEGYAGDGFLALVGGPTPTRTAWEYALELQRRFREQTRPILLDLGVRTGIFLRIGLHLGEILSFKVEKEGVEAHISEAICVAARIVSCQTSRRRGHAMSRAMYKRLFRAGNKEIRDPDEVIQDLNKYPEPIEVFYVRPEEQEFLRNAPPENTKVKPAKDKEASAPREAPGLPSP